MSQKELSAKLGTAQTTVSGWENEAKKPGIETVIQIADIFGVTLDYLLGRTDNPFSVVKNNNESTEVPPFEKKILERFNQVSQDTQIAVCNVLGLEHPVVERAKTKTPS